VIKEEIKDNAKMQKVYATTFNIFEILVILYCLVFFCDILPKDFIKIINIKTNNSVTNDTYYQNEYLQNCQSKIKNLSNKVNAKNNYGTSLLDIYSSIKIVKVFHILKNINIVKIYIVNSIYNIVYSIYNKSRKRNRICSIKSSKLCFN